MRHASRFFVIAKWWMALWLNKGWQDRGTPEWKEDVFRGTLHVNTEICSLWHPANFWGRPMMSFSRISAVVWARNTLPSEFWWSIGRSPAKSLNKLYTTDFRYSGICHHYVSICFVVLKNFLCSCIGHVTYGFILHSTGLEKVGHSLIARRHWMSWTTARDKYATILSLDSYTPYREENLPILNSSLMTISTLKRRYWCKYDDLFWKLPSVEITEKATVICGRKKTQFLL